MNSAYVTLSRQTLVSVFATLSIYARNFFLLPLLTHYFSRAEYGVWVQIISLVEILVALTSLNMSSALLRYLPQRRNEDRLADDLGSILLLAGCASLLVAALGALVADEVARIFLGGEEYAFYMRAALALLPVSVAVNLLLMYFRASRQIGLYSGLLIGESAAYIGFVFLALSAGMGFWGVLVSLFLLKLLLCMGSGFLAFRQTGFAPPTFSCVRAFLNFGLPLMPIGVFSWINNISDRYIIGFFNGPEAVGVYSVSYAIGSLVGLFFAPMFFALDPALTESWEDRDWGLIDEYLRYAQKYPLMAALPVTVVITLLNDLFIGLLTTDQYLTHAALVGLVALGIIVMNMSALAENVVRLLGRTRVFPLYYGICALFNLAANAVLIPLWGYYWAAATTLATYGLQLILMYLYVRRHFAFSWNWPVIGRIGMACAAMGLCIWPFREGAWPVQIQGMFLGGGVYLLALWGLGVFEKREWNLLKSMVGLKTN